MSPPVQPDGRPSSDAAREYLEHADAGVVQVFDWVHLDGQGRERWCEVRLVRLPGTGRRQVRASITDVTERRRAAGEQELLREQLHHAQKLEAIGRLTGGLAHDFNNLLAVITGNLELLGDLLETGTEPEELRSEAMDAARRAGQLTRRLLAFARRQELAPCHTRVSHLLDGLEGLLRTSLGEGIRLVLDPGPPDLACLVDPGQLENALINLAINARDAMEGRGRLEIRASSEHLEHDQATPEGIIPAGDHVVITVEDSGCGMSEQVRARVFEPFFTTKAAGKGSGLGLSMVHGFVIQSRGGLRLHSVPGLGTRLELLLPRDTPDPAPAVPAPAGVGEAHTGRILLVEDETPVRTLATTMLERCGWQVLGAAGSEQALAFVDQGIPLDLLFTDLVLPGPLNGFELAREIRARRPGLPVLYTSGRVPPPDPGDGTDFALLEKPYTREQLAGMVERMVGRGKAAGGNGSQ